MPVLDRSAPLLLVKLQATKADEFRVVTDDVLTFQYVDAERKADKATLTVRNEDLSQFDDPVWRKGSRLIFQWGYPAAMSPPRVAVITSVKGFKELTIEARAESVLMNKSTRSRSFDGQRISDIARAIAKEYGYGDSQQHIDETEQVLEVVSQSNRTDAQFLRRWASRLGFEFYVDFDGFHFHERRLGSRPVRVLRYHIDQGGGDILGEPSIENDITARPGKVTVKGRDAKTRKDIDESADNDSDTGRDTLGPVLELTVDRDTGATSSKIIPEERLGADTTVITADKDSTAAQRRAKGRFRRAQLVAVKMGVTIIGDPLMLAKSIVQIEGMGKRLSIRYYVEEVTHSFSTSGYTCSLKLVSDGHGGHSTVSTKARGFSAFTGGRGGGTGKRRDDILALFLTATDVAKRENDSVAVGALAKAGNAYKSGADASAVNKQLARIRAGTKSEAVRVAVSNVITALSQRGGEVENKGQLNDKTAVSDDGLLEIELGIDADSGKTVSQFKQTRGRGQ